MSFDFDDNVNDDFDEVFADEGFEIEDIEDEVEERPQKPSLPELLEALKAGEPDKPSSTVFYGLSGLSDADIQQIQPTWKRLIPRYRRRVMRELIEVSETNFEMDYRAVGFFGMDDPDAGVREAAIELLWEDETLELMSVLIEKASTESEVRVRGAVATGLGRFILLGELGDLPETETVRAQDAVIAMLKDEGEDVLVRRRALEAIANCSHPIVPGAIREAYYGSNDAMRISAVFAMGRTCDERWEDMILEELESEDPEMCYEAARAAGELELIDAVPKLARLLTADDREITLVIVWSLGEIGGKEAIRLLSLLEEKAEDEEDDDLLQAVEDAIGNAAFADELPEID